jgi:peptide/nickel transport system substrate-binding protein
MREPCDFHLTDVYVPFETLIGQPIFWIMQCEVIEGDGYATKRDVGSGPFIFDRFKPGISLSGRRNPHYYRPAEPHINDFVGLIIPDTSTQLAALRSSQMDYYQLRAVT